jgi:hypothetical protein
MRSAENGVDFVYCRVKIVKRSSGNRIDHAVIVYVAVGFSYEDHGLSKCVGPEYLSDRPDRRSIRAKEVRQHQIAPCDIGTIAVQNLLSVAQMLEASCVIEAQVADNCFVDRVAHRIDGNETRRKPVADVLTPVARCRL